MRAFSNLANIVLTRTYKRPTPNGLESFSDVVERVIAGNVKNHNVSEQEIQRLKYFLTERKAGPGGRGWWFSGTEAQKKLGGLGLVNCWTLAADDWMNFIAAQQFLMAGGGCGMTVEAKYSDKLPKVKKDVLITHKLANDADYIVPDSREGWCKLLQRVLEAFFVTGRGFSYSTICVRQAGLPIKGFGGISSGPRPLVRMIEKICMLMVSRQGRKLRPIDCADLICCIGEMVVSGNVRRSAILILGDAHDQEFLKAKRWDLGPIPTQRAMANFSVNCSDAEHDLRPLFWKTYKAGEAFGIVNIKNLNKYGRMVDGARDDDNSVCVNPCQPDWATVLTPEGIRQFKDIDVGSTIWSGKRWTKVINKVCTGTKEVYSYKTTAGIFYGTENHKILSSGIKVEVDKATSIDMIIGGLSTKTTKLDPQDVMDGLVIGDGSTHKASNNLTYLLIGKKDGCVTDKNSEVFHLFKCYRPGIIESAWEIWTTIKGPLPKTYNRTIPDKFRFGAPEKIRGFLRGLFSANGSIAGKRVTLKAASFKVIEQVQEMLSALGIASYYTTNKSKEVQFSNGVYTQKQSYDLNIRNIEGILLFQKLIGFIHPYKMEALQEAIDILTDKKRRISKKSYNIIEKSFISKEPVYSITVDDEEHTYWSGGLHVGNCGEMSGESAKVGQGGGGEPCNLQDINLSAINDPNEFFEAAALMHRWGKRVTIENYYFSQSNEIIDRNRRIGTGITGCLMRPDLFNPDVLDKAYKAIQKENVEYAKELNIPPSIRSTVIKPSGTLSKMWDVPCEGIHPAFSRYFIQRIRIASNDALIPKLMEAGHYMEPQLRLDGTPDSDTMVVDFYVKTPDGLPTADEGFDTWKQLEVVQMAQKYWADQSISTTVYYKDEDIPKIQEWLKNNLDSIKTISFLKYSDHGFKQAPKEKITEEQYEKLSAKVSPIGLDEITEDGDMVEGGECAGGACPIR